MDDDHLTSVTSLIYFVTVLPVYSILKTLPHFPPIGGPVLIWCVQFVTRGETTALIRGPEY